MWMPVCEKEKITIQNIDLEEIYFEKIYKAFIDKLYKLVIKEKREKNKIWITIYNYKNFSEKKFQKYNKKETEKWLDIKYKGKIKFPKKSHARIII